MAFVTHKSWDTENSCKDEIRSAFGVGSNKRGAAGALSFGMLGNRV